MTKAQVIALIDQYITTNGNEEITGAQTNSVMKALANQDIPFSEIVSKPTTLSGYGITDAYTKSVSDGRYAIMNNINANAGQLTIKTLNDYNRGLRLINDNTSQSSFLYMDDSDELNINNGSTSTRPVHINKGGNGGLVVGGTVTAANLSGTNTGDQTLSGLGGVPTTRTIIAGTGLTGGGNLSSNLTINVNFGTSAGTVLEGNWRPSWSQVTGKPSTFPPSPHTHTFASLTSKPTTISGYGITNAYNKTESDSRYVNVTGDTMTGDLTAPVGIFNGSNQPLRVVGTGEGDANDVYIPFYESNGTTRQAYIGFGTTANSDFTIQNGVSGKNLVLSDSGVLNYNGGITASGNITATAFYESSDIRLKKNISPLNYGLKEIEKIDTHTWNWKKDGTEDMGVIAQELELVMPELVKTDKEGYKSVNYTKLVPVLINAIKELSNGKK